MCNYNENAPRARTRERFHLLPSATRKGESISAYDIVLPGHDIEGVRRSALLAFGCTLAKLQRDNDIDTVATHARVHAFTRVRHNVSH